MKKKILCILVSTLLMILTSGAVAQTIEMNQQSKPVPNEMLPTEKVKEIPVPWQFWEEFASGVIDIIILYEEVESAVAIVRDYLVLEEGIPLDDLTWEGTMHMDWIPIDHPMEPYILAPGGSVDYPIQLGPLDQAALIRYTVAWAETPDVIEAHFVNEAILESRTILGSLSNFDVHNDYHEDINNFELELYGDISPADVVDVYDPPGDPYKSGNIWYGGWGAPPAINAMSYGIEILWLDKEHPVKPCEWFHCGVTLNPYVNLNGARAFLTITKSKDATANFEITMPRNRAINTPFLNFLQNHPNLFPILQRLLQRLGLQ